MPNKGIHNLYRFENLPGKGVENCSLFAVYDGHGGSQCCNFLKEKLHSQILLNYDPHDISNSIRKSCLSLDDEFLKKARTEYKCDTSGSCALVLVCIGTQKITKTRT